MWKEIQGTVDLFRGSGGCPPAVADSLPATSLNRFYRLGRPIVFRQSAETRRLAACAPRIRLYRYLACCLALVLGTTATLLAETRPLELSLPTDNDALFRADDWWQSRTTVREGLVELEKLGLDYARHPW